MEIPECLSVNSSWPVFNSSWSVFNSLWPVLNSITKRTFCKMFRHHLFHIITNINDRAALHLISKFTSAFETNDIETKVLNTFQRGIANECTGMRQTRLCKQ